MVTFKNGSWEEKIYVTEKAEITRDVFTKISIALGLTIFNQI